MPEAQAALRQAGRQEGLSKGLSRTMTKPLCKESSQRPNQKGDLKGCANQGLSTSVQESGATKSGEILIYHFNQAAKIYNITAFLHSKSHVVFEDSV